MESQSLSNILISSNMSGSYRFVNKSKISPNIECIQVVLLLLTSVEMKSSLLANNKGYKILNSLKKKSVKKTTT